MPQPADSSFEIEVIRSGMKGCVEEAYRNGLVRNARNVADIVLLQSHKPDGHFGLHFYRPIPTHRAGVFGDRLGQNACACAEGQKARVRVDVADNAIELAGFVA